MSNPLFQALGGGQPQSQGPMQNMGNMLQQFQQFKRTFQGDPKQQVMQLLSSGKMSQQQYNQLAQTAQQIMGMMQ